MADLVAAARNCPLSTVSGDFRQKVKVLMGGSGVWGGKRPTTQPPRVNLPDYSVQPTS